MIHKFPVLFRYFLPKAWYRIPAKNINEKVIYLTFDDGPIPEVTPFVLEYLEKYAAKATFFCIGDNIQKYPEVFAKILDAQHTVGNHTQNHLNGWKTSDDLYFKNIENCQKYIPTRLFRPPYGRLTFGQYQKVSKSYKIVLWDILSGDYSANISPEECLKNTQKYIQNGSIVVFHDSLKAQKNLIFTLPKILEFFTQEGYQFRGLNHLF